jgi:FG-GAP-like repeat
MFPRLNALFPTLSLTFLLSITCFILAVLAGGTAQVNPVEVTALKFTQRKLPIGAAAYNNGGTSAIVTGDFNNDGILDVVTIDETSTQSEVSFFKGLGGGKFSTTPVTTPLRVSQETTVNGSAFAADFNSDRKLDLAISTGLGPGPVTIMLGNGDGTFRPGQSITVKTDTGPGIAAAIALADFNGDHIPDIAISDGTAGYTWIYLGNGNGTFKLADTQKYGGNSVVAGDFDADGKQDVAFASGLGSGGSTVGLFLGSGNGTLAAPVLATVSDVTGLAVGDFYNDRIQSLAVLSSEGPVDGNDTTYLVTLRYSNAELEVGPKNQVTGAVAEGPTFIAAGDLNGDFIDDVFIVGGGYHENALTQYMLGNGDGTFQAPQNTPYDTQGNAFRLPVIRDMNLNSRHDVSIAWGNVEDDNGGGNVLLNDNATPNCDVPAANALSVNICMPKSGATISKTYTFKGSGNAFNGIAKHMELWIDGTKVGQDLEDQLKITTTLSAGSHTASFVVVDSFDSYTSKSVTFTTR